MPGTRPEFGELPYIAKGRSKVSFALKLKAGESQKCLLSRSKNGALGVNRSFVSCQTEGVLTKMAKMTNLHSNQ